MPEEKISKGRALGLAALWTAVTAVWLALFLTWIAFREFAPAALGALAGVALLLSMVICVMWWRCWLETRKSEDMEHNRGGKKHER